MKFSLLFCWIFVLSCSHLPNPARVPSQALEIPEECGLTGPLQERISDCKLKYSSKSDLKLFMRKFDQDKIVSFYHDVRNKLIWADPGEKLTDHEEATKICKDLEPLGLSSITYIWDLASMQQLLILRTKAEIPLAKTYWSKDKHADRKDWAWIIFMKGRLSHDIAPQISKSARALCLARKNNL